MERRKEDGRVSFLVVLMFLVILALVAGGWAAFRMTDRAAPTVKVTSDSKAIGRSVRITIEADEPKYGIRDLRASFVQGPVTVPLGEQTYPRNPWYRFWRRHGKGSVLLEVEVGKQRIPEMKEGTAIIRAEATNDSWAKLGKGRVTVTEASFPVILTPPRVEVMSSQHYLNQGGSECVLYRVSESTAESGVRAGDYFFRGYPVPGGGPGDRFAIFAFPYDLPASTVPVVAARDAAGNEGSATFTFKLFPKVFQHQKLEVSDSFLQRVVPSILSQSPLIESQGNLLKDFLQINGRLRRIDAARLVEMAGDSKPERLWHGAFVQLGNSKVEAAFADHRSYMYQGRVVDEQDHLGFDLAVTANHPVEAANDGVVMMAQFFGIYGNTVVIDHGYGLMTLYAHLSSIDVKNGDPVKRGQAIGRSGATGLAGGDHLHFSVLLQGVPVNPIEWWDAHWIQDRIDSKIGPKAAEDQPAAAGNRPPAAPGAPVTRAPASPAGHPG